ncbi:MAG: DUF3153 domain-containing protein [Prochlorothrix sp.]|nr:DUF3153 domain-containing protein [Prochlorothrix sp.]
MQQDLRQGPEWPIPGQTIPEQPIPEQHKRRPILRSRLRQILRSILLVVVASCLSGCLQYDLGLRFDHQTSGAIVQTFTLTPETRSLGTGLLQEWFVSLDRQAPTVPSLGQWVTPDRYVMTIPFAGAMDLTQKFTQVIPPAATATAAATVPQSSSTTAPLAATAAWRGALPPIAATLNLEQDNRLLAIHTHLNLTLDLRPLARLDRQGRSLLAPSAPLQINFSLETPWGLDWAETSPTVSPQQWGRRVIWSLPVGAVTTIETAFWLPSPVGIGSIGIGLLMLLGWGLRRLR